MNFFASIIVLKVALSHGTEENSRLLPFLLRNIQHKELNAQAQGNFEIFNRYRTEKKFATGLCVPFVDISLLIFRNEFERENSHGS